MTDLNQIPFDTLEARPHTTQQRQIARNALKKWNGDTGLQQVAWRGLRPGLRRPKSKRLTW